MNVAAHNRECVRQQKHQTSLLDDHRAVEPPESFPNSEVKRSIADGSVGLPHVRVGHRQASNPKPQQGNLLGFFFMRSSYPVALLGYG